MCYFVSLDNKQIKVIFWATFYTLARVSNSFIMRADCPLINTRWTFKGYLFTTASLLVTVQCEHNRQRSVGSSDSSERLLPLHVSLSASREVRGSDGEDLREARWFRSFSLPALLGRSARVSLISVMMNSNHWHTLARHDQNEVKTWKWPFPPKLACIKIGCFELKLTRLIFRTMIAMTTVSS